MHAAATCRVWNRAGRAARALVVLGLAACTAFQPNVPLPAHAARSGDELLIVDCLLPGQIRRLGQRATYVTQRRPVRVPARECEIRGGEYTAYDRATLASSLLIWLPVAEAGDAEAQTNVGELYEKGIGGAPDFDAAAQWYRRAAEQGNARAQINLGHLYEKGLGVTQSSAQALAWYRRASGLDEAVLIDPGTLSNQRARIEALEGEVETLRGRLRDAERELERGRRQASSERDALARDRIVFVQKTEQVPVGAPLPPDLSAEKQRLDERERELGRLEAALAERQEEVERDRVAARRHRAELEKLASRPGPAPVAAGAGVSGPSIELIEPPLVATRGLAVAVRSGTQSREIVGRVTAPAGLFSLTLNGRKLRPSDAGLFKSAIELRTARTPVKIVAVDKQGKSASVEFNVESGFDGPTPRPPRPEPGVTTAGVQFGNYHALVIGNDDYQSMPDLRSAISDARAVAGVLRERYGFKVTLLENATRYEILSAFNEMRASLTSEDNLLIYYAGHGELDSVNMRGHWLPVDAERENPANWISNVSVTDMLNAMSAKQIMLIVDACYSGALTRSGMARLPAGRTDRERMNLIRQLASKRSRTVLTSGGLKPVMDVGGGDHSVFAKAVLEVLRSNEGVLEGQRLYREVAARVAYAASRAQFDQVPEYAPIQHAGHEAGDFFLVPSS